MDISAKRSLVGKVSEKVLLTGQIAISNTVIVDHEEYEGPYEVKPVVEPQTISTKEKLMKEDLVVLAIPYVEVTNTSNGITVTIGE